MTLYQKGGSKVYTVRVQTATTAVRRSTGTEHKPTARSMERMVDDLRNKREWDLLGRVVDSTLALGQLHDAWSKNDLSGLRASLDDVDLEPHVATYVARLAKRVAADTVEHYTHTLRTLFPVGKAYPRSRLTVDALDAWISAYEGADGTRRKAHAAMSGFLKYLVTARVLGDNPMRNVAPPKPGKSRCRYEDVQSLQRISDAQPSPFREVNALLAGTGIEVSVALALLRRHVDVGRREIRAAGTKTYCRDRVVRVAEWAWPYVEAALRGKLPDAPLFSGLDRYAVSDAHRAACKALGVTDYQLRDHRHSYAVRAARAGTPAELIARQLGHANAVMVLKVYGNFMPSAAERDRWELIAAAQDAATREAK